MGYPKIFRYAVSRQVQGLHEILHPLFGLFATRELAPNDLASKKLRRLVVEHFGDAVIQDKMKL